jgi:hypothetical protein
MYLVENDKWTTNNRSLLLQDPIITLVLPSQAILRMTDAMPLRFWTKPPAMISYHSEKLVAIGISNHSMTELQMRVV